MRRALRDEGAGGQGVVEEGVWSNRRRTCKGLHGTVCSSSMRINVSGDNGSDVDQDKCNRSSTMVFFGASHLVPGAIEAMFRPGRSCQVKLLVGSDADRLEVIAGVTSPGTTVSVLSLCFGFSLSLSRGVFPFKKTAHYRRRRRRVLLQFNIVNWHRPTGCVPHPRKFRFINTRTLRCATHVFLCPSSYHSFSGLHPSLRESLFFCF